MERAPKLCADCERELRAAAKRILEEDDDPNLVAYLMVPEDRRVPMVIRGISGDGRDLDYGAALLTKLDA